MEQWKDYENNQESLLGYGQSYIICDYRIVAFLTMKMEELGEYTLGYIFIWHSMFLSSVIQIWLLTTPRPLELKMSENVFNLKFTQISKWILG